MCTTNKGRATLWQVGLKVPTHLQKNSNIRTDVDDFYEFDSTDAKKLPQGTH